MALTVDQRGSLGTVNGGTSVASTFASKPSSGDTIVAVVSGGNFGGASALATSVTDTASNVYTRRTSIEDSGHEAGAEIWSVDNATAPAGTWTVTAHFGGSEFGSIYAVALSGCGGFDAAATPSSTSNTASGTISVTSTVDGDYFVGVLGSDPASNPANPHTASGGFTDEQLVTNGSASEIYLASDLTSFPAAGSQTWGWAFTGTGTWKTSVCLACFKPAATAAPPGGFAGPINPGQTWRRFFWRGITNPIPGSAAGTGPVVNTVTASDTLSALSDTAIRAAQAASRTASDSLAALSDTATRAAQAASRTASDALSALSDTATRALQAFTRTASDAPAAPTDAATRTTQASSRTAADALASPADAAARAPQAFTRTATDSPGTPTDAAARSAQQAIRTSPDSLAALTDSASRAVQAFVRTATESITALSDQAFKAGQHATVTAADTLTALSDSATRSAQQAARSASDGLAALSDVASRAAQGFLRTVADVIAALVDIATNGAGPAVPTRDIDLYCAPVLSGWTTNVPFSGWTTSDLLSGWYEADPETEE